MYGLSGREKLESGLIVVWGPTGFASGSEVAAEGESLPAGQPTYRISVYKNCDDEEAGELLMVGSFHTSISEVVDREVREAIEEAQRWWQ